MSENSTMTLKVKGLHCEHCVASVTEELEELPDVQSVTVDLAPDEISTVTISVSATIEHDSLNAAVNEAGYELVSVE